MLRSIGRSVIRSLGWCMLPLKARKGRFRPASRLPLCLFGGVGIGVVWMGHAIAQRGNDLARITLQNAVLEATPDFSRNIVPIMLLVIVVCVICLYLAEGAIRIRADTALADVGALCVGASICIVLITGVGVAILTALTPSLLNAWDQGFLWVLIGVQYIGVFLYLYYGVPLARWASQDRDIELRQLELAWEHQQMLLKAFAAITVTILVGQVFGVLKLKYDQVWKDAEALQRQTPHILINAVELVFLVLGWWGLVFSRVLERMEEIQLRLREFTPAEKN